MARFILHIGDGKCGSTAIQEALYEARDRLAARGVLYETATPKSGHYTLANLVGGSTRGDRAAQMVSAHRSIERIKARSSGFENILLTAEPFIFIGPERLLQLLSTMGTEMDELHVLAYVRSPADMYLSLVQQQLKADHRFVLPSSYERPLDRALEAWQRHPAVTSLTVRRFEREALVDGDVVKDFESFLHAITGIEGMILGGSEANASMSAEQVVLLQALRQQECKDVPGMRRPVSDSLERAFDEMNGSGRLGSSPALRSEAASIVTSRCADVVNRLNDLFPDLCLAHTSGLVERHDGPSGAAPDAHDVKTVLRDVDELLVSRLARLIPAMNDGLAGDSAPEARRALEGVLAHPVPDEDRFFRAVEHYWRREGCDGGVAQLVALEADRRSSTAGSIPDSGAFS